MADQPWLKVRLLLLSAPICSQVDQREAYLEMTKKTEIAHLEMEVQQKYACLVMRAKSKEKKKESNERKKQRKLIKSNKMELGRMEGGETGAEGMLGEQIQEIQDNQEKIQDFLGEHSFVLEYSAPNHQEKGGLCFSTNVVTYL